MSLPKKDFEKNEICHFYSHMSNYHNKLLLEVLGNTIFWCKSHVKGFGIYDI